MDHRRRVVKMMWNYFVSGLLGHKGTKDKENPKHASRGAKKRSLLGRLLLFSQKKKKLRFFLVLL